LLIFFSAVQLYSQGADYPYIMNNGTIFINTGVGFGSSGVGFGSLKLEKNINTKTLCPPITVSMDIAIPVLGFPVSLGLTAGYFSESGSVTDSKSGSKIETDLSGLLVAGRIAYHFNFLKQLPRLDTYALLTIGGIISNNNVSVTPKVGNKSSKESDKQYFWFGINAGARYFFTPNIGAFVELGLDTIQNLSFGVSFKL